jgi:hypothetical protein
MAFPTGKDCAMESLQCICFTGRGCNLAVVVGVVIRFGKNSDDNCTAGVVHSIPGSRPLQDGDIINVDVSVFVDGYHGDLSETFLVGKVDAEGMVAMATVHHCIPKLRQNAKLNATLQVNLVVTPSRL